MFLFVIFPKFCWLAVNSNLSIISAIYTGILWRYFSWELMFTWVNLGFNISINLTHFLFQVYLYSIGRLAREFSTETFVFISMFYICLYLAWYRVLHIFMDVVQLYWNISRGARKMDRRTKILSETCKIFSKI